LAERLRKCEIYIDNKSIINDYNEVIPPLIGLTEVAEMIGWYKRKASV